MWLSEPGGNSMAGRANGVLEAGCDIALHCSGDFAEMHEVAEALPTIGAAALARLERAMAWAAEPAGETEALAHRRDALLDQACVRGGYSLAPEGMLLFEGLSAVEVLAGKAAVITTEGEDVTEAFVSGARQALALVERHGIRIAILKANSPSCGNRLTYDGSFRGVKVEGQGVTAALLTRAGVQVFSELELEEAAKALGVLTKK